MRLFNTMSGVKEDFHPYSDIVTIYVCGVTPYDTTHIGHATTYITFDVLSRYLQYQGYGVRYTQNVTDIDDDILKRSAQLGMGWQELGREQTRLFLEDLEALYVLLPQFYPHATEETSGMIEIVKSLLAQGLAYERDGWVYYRVAKDPDYGKLSHLSRTEMLPIANERGNDPHDPRKDEPLDFLLWQGAKPGEPTWPSPWGPGRPGWHIECSAMSLRYLGQQIDIHGGGSDLIFPHHESEIAQSEHYTGKKPFVQIWMHTGMVRYQGEKMSKSLGNLVFAREVLKHHSADALRLYISDHPYREAWDYEDDGPARNEALAGTLRQALTGRQGTGPSLDVEDYRQGFCAALDDDLDTHRAIAVLSDLGHLILASPDHETRAARLVLADLAGVLGLPLSRLGELPRRRPSK